MEKKINKYDKMRDLLCYAINELLTREVINLDIPNKGDMVTGTLLIDILGKQSVVSWIEHEHDEITIKIWWGIKYNCEGSPYFKTQPKTLNGIVDVSCSCWFERKDGKYIQGHGLKKDLMDKYCSNSAKPELLNIPKPKTLGYKREGIFQE